MFFSIYFSLTCINSPVPQAGVLLAATDLKSTNPFDIPFDTDLEPNNEVCYVLIHIEKFLASIVSCISAFISIILIIKFIVKAGYI